MSVLSKAVVFVFFFSLTETLIGTLLKFPIKTKQKIEKDISYI